MGDPFRRQGLSPLAYPDLMPHPLRYPVLLPLVDIDAVYGDGAQTQEDVMADIVMEDDAVYGDSAQAQEDEDGAQAQEDEGVREEEDIVMEDPQFGRSVY